MKGTPADDALFQFDHPRRGDSWVGRLDEPELVEIVDARFQMKQGNGILMRHHAAGAGGIEPPNGGKDQLDWSPNQGAFGKNGQDRPPATSIA
jgi:hypothetical protein